MSLNSQEKPRIIKMDRESRKSLMEKTINDQNKIITELKEDLEKRERSPSAEKKIVERIKFHEGLKNIYLTNFYHITPRRTPRMTPKQKEENKKMKFYSEYEKKKKKTPFCPMFDRCLYKLKRLICCCYSKNTTYTQDK